MKKIGLVFTGILLIAAGLIIFAMESSDITMKIAGGSIVAAGLAFLVESAKKNKK